jgi:hypothetical protein
MVFFKNLYLAGGLPEIWLCVLDCPGNPWPRVVNTKRKLPTVVFEVYVADLYHSADGMSRLPRCGFGSAGLIVLLAGAIDLSDATSPRQSAVHVAPFKQPRGKLV